MGEIVQQMFKKRRPNYERLRWRVRERILLFVLGIFCPQPWEGAKGPRLRTIFIPPREQFVG